VFTFLNVIFIVIAATNLYGVISRASPSVREISLQLIGTDGGLERLRAALTLAVLAQVYLIALVFPLKALNHDVGLAWAVLMLVAALESVYTGRKMWETVATGDRAARFPLHDSPWYQVWQVGYNVATIAACAWLVLPR
jgi:hypothetical protein